MLPGNGHLAIAFKLDNPGAWLIHCHIAWHSSEGLALELVESEKSITLAPASTKALHDTCRSWERWSSKAPWEQDDSGI